MKELSLRPYSGNLFVATTRKEYEAAHKKIFRRTELLCVNQRGRFAGGEDNNGVWTYLVYGDDQQYLTHEIAHAILHTFERCGIDPREANGEPFCYMLSQLLLESK